MKHLLSVADLGGRRHRGACCALTDSFVEVSRAGHPQGARRCGARPWRSLFYEDSTRTRLSLRDGGQAAVGRHHELLGVGTSSVTKGESLRDTVETIEAMGVDAIVVRHALAGRARARSPAGSTPSVINAGDGWHEHPTQALLDCYTIREHLGGLDGLRIAIVGDIKHSPGGPLATSLAFTHARRRGHPGGAAHAAAAAPRGLAGAGQPRPRRGAAQGRRRLPAAHAAGAHDRGAAARRCGSTPPATGSPAAGPTCCGDDGPRHAPRAHEPGRRDRRRGRRPAPLGDHRPGAQRRGRAHGGAVPAAGGSGRGALGRRSDDELDSVIRGGAVVDAAGARRADVLVDATGAIVAVGRRRVVAGGRRASSTPAGASSRPAWSTSTPTCASPAGRRPRRSRPAPGPPRSAGTPRSSPCPTPTRHRLGAAWCARCWSSGRGACATCARPGAITVGRAGRASWRRWPRWPPSACGSSPTTAPACRTPA